jgi:trans-aconitate methyltransferase
VKFADGSKWVDGGYARNRNNPINEALAEVAREKTLKDRDIGCLLSIGTGVP